MPSREEVYQNYSNRVQFFARHYLFGSMPELYDQLEGDSLKLVLEGARLSLIELDSYKEN